MHILIEAKHRAISVHPELWYPFLHNKKREEKGRNLPKCTCKHCASGRILEGKELELSVQRI